MVSDFDETLKSQKAEKIATHQMQNLVSNPLSNFHQNLIRGII